MARYDGVRYGFRAREGDTLSELYRQTRSRGFGSEVKKRIILGTHVLRTEHYDDYYWKALKVRTLIKQDFEKVFRDYDLIATPTSPTTAFKLGAKNDDPQTVHSRDNYTRAANLTGIPAISIPCGFVEGLPVGLQIMGRPFEEGRMLQFCYALEDMLGVKGYKPEISVEGGH